jgi:hypothetical protein
LQIKSLVTRTPEGTSPNGTEEEIRFDGKSPIERRRNSASKRFGIEEEEEIRAGIVPIEEWKRSTRRRRNFGTTREKSQNRSKEKENRREKSHDRRGGIGESEEEVRGAIITTTLFFLI